MERCAVRPSASFVVLVCSACLPPSKRFGHPVSKLVARAGCDLSFSEHHLAQLPKTQRGCRLSVNVLSECAWLGRPLACAAFEALGAMPSEVLSCMEDYMID